MHEIFIGLGANNNFPQKRTEDFLISNMQESSREKVKLKAIFTWEFFKGGRQNTF